MIPTPIYEALPYTYLLVGTSALAGIDIIVAKIIGLILAIMGVMIYQARRRYRRHKLRLGNVRSGPSHPHKTHQDIAKSNDDFQKGEVCYERCDYQEAFQWYRKAAEQGNPSAQINLGAMYAEGRGIDQDFQAALTWYLKAAQQGETLAYYNLGVMYVEGQGVPRNFQEALTWYRQAAIHGHAQAQFNLGLMYEQIRDALSLKEAAAWYRQAAAQGYAPAQVNLGAMYIDGRGVPQDAQEARQWYQAAAYQGYAPAQFNLGAMYLKGHQGLAKDLTMAYVWFSRSAQQGDSDAQYWRNQVATRLTVEQKAQAQQLLQPAVVEYRNSQLGDFNPFSVMREPDRSFAA
jgi:TPR repeat protein